MMTKSVDTKQFCGYKNMSVLSKMWIQNRFVDTKIESVDTKIFMKNLYIAKTENNDAL